MFTGINVNDYKLGWDIPKALFLRDCLKGEFRFEKSLGGNPEIYKINSDGTERKTYWEEVVYFVQTVVPGYLREQEDKLREEYIQWSKDEAIKNADVTEYNEDKFVSSTGFCADVSDRFFGCFHDSDEVEKAIKNLGICLRFEG